MQSIHFPIHVSLEKVKILHPFKGFCDCNILRNAFFRVQKNSFPCEDKLLLGNTKNTSVFMLVSPFNNKCRIHRWNPGLKPRVNIQTRNQSKRAQWGNKEHLCQFY